MDCPPVRRDNPRALASGLSYVPVDKHGITNYTTYISADLAHRDIFRANVGIIYFMWEVGLCRLMVCNIFLFALNDLM